MQDATIKSSQSKRTYEKPVVTRRSNLLTVTANSGGSINGISGSVPLG